MQLLLALLPLWWFMLATCSEEKADKDIHWDYLTYAQVWPYSVCDVANLMHNDSCSVPKEVTSGWTIHGLWPSRLQKGLGPFKCVPKDHFDLDKVKPLVPELLHHWPNIIPDEPLYSLWQHEWIKHGTCAEQLAEINGEANYFSKGLEFNEQFSIKNILSEAGIQPSDQPQFKVADVVAALVKVIEKKVQVHCLKSPKGDWYLVDVRVCLDKKLEPLDCPHPQPAGGGQHDKEEQEHNSSGKSELLESLSLPNVQLCPNDSLLHYPSPRPDHFHSDQQHQAHSHTNKYQQDHEHQWDTFHHNHDHEEL